MQFLSDLYLTCPECEGSRYSQAALEIRFDGKSIAEVLALTAVSYTHLTLPTIYSV